METNEGYHYEWKPDPQWTFGTQYDKCRQPRCPNPPVAELGRYSYTRRKTFQYAYCAAHLYGRRINNGVIEHRIVVRDEAA